ncbi:putative multicopper oxidase, type 2 [Helianthus anomalus]
MSLSSPLTLPSNLMITLTLEAFFMLEEYLIDGCGLYEDTSVMGVDFRAYVEIVFENPSDIVLSYHIVGYQFFVVGPRLKKILQLKNSSDKRSTDLPKSERQCSRIQKAILNT